MGTVALSAERLGSSHVSPLQKARNVDVMSSSLNLGRLRLACGWSGAPPFTASMRPVAALHHHGMVGEDLLIRKYRHSPLSPPFPSSNYPLPDVTRLRTRGALFTLSNETPH